MPISVLSFNSQMNSKTTAYIAMTIAVLVLLYPTFQLCINQYALAYVNYHGFSLEHIPCVWIHGGHVHCI